VIETKAKNKNLWKLQKETIQIKYKTRQKIAQTVKIRKKLSNTLHLKQKPA